MPLVCAEYRRKGGKNEPSQIESLLVCAKYRERRNRPSQIESPLVWANYTQAKKWAVSDRVATYLGYYRQVKKKKKGGGADPYRMANCLG